MIDDAYNKRVVTAARASSLIYGISKAGPEGVFLIPANACPAVPLAVMEAGRQFEFIDIDPQSLSLCVAQATRRIQTSSESKIAGVIYIHSYGYTARSDEDLQNLRNAMGAKAILIDDRCLSWPETQMSRFNRSPADAVIWSTGPKKSLDLNHGGYGLFRNDLPFSLPEYEVSGASFDSIMQRYKTAIDEQAPIFSNPVVCRELPKWIPNEAGPLWADYEAEIISKTPAILTHKTKLNNIYQSQLAHFSSFSMAQQLWRFNIRVKNQQAILKRLFEAGLFASNHYYPSSNLWGVNNMIDAETLSRTIINLFNDQYFTAEMAQESCNIIKEFGRPIDKNAAS